MRQRTPGKSDVRYRLSLLMDLWSKIIDEWESNKRLSRSEVVGKLREHYTRAGIKPIKGASNPPDLYDKEMASLYVVGKYGMGLDEQYPDIFDEIFVEEMKYEAVISTLMSESGEMAREKVKALMGELGDNTIARMFRLKLTQVYFGFASRDSLVNLIKSFKRLFPHKSRLISKYTRFYIAFRIAEAINSGEVRDRISKEALKQATALELEAPKNALPDDSYVKKIAMDVFNLPERKLSHILPASKKRKAFSSTR